MQAVGNERQANFERRAAAIVRNQLRDEDYHYQ
jgi:hypothetical protein